MKMLFVEFLLSLGVLLSGGDSHLQAHGYTDCLKYSPAEVLKMPANTTTAAQNDLAFLSDSSVSFVSHYFDIEVKRLEEDDDKFLPSKRHVEICSFFNPLFYSHLRGYFLNRINDHSSFDFSGNSLFRPLHRVCRVDRV